MSVHNDLEKEKVLDLAWGRMRTSLIFINRTITHLRCMSGPQIHPEATQTLDRKLFTTASEFSRIQQVLTIRIIACEA